MSFPIFFKMEIKKGWRKSCDFVISNPVSGVSRREPVVRALHSQRSAQIHTSLSARTEPQTCVATRGHRVGVRARTERPHCPARLVPSSPAQTRESAGADVSTSTSLSAARLRWSGQTAQTTLTFHLQLTRVCSAENFK